MDFMEEANDPSDSSSCEREYRGDTTRRKRPSKLTIEDQFEQAINWNAVLLFDECDAHLGRRTDTDEKLILNSKHLKDQGAVLLMLTG